MKQALLTLWTEFKTIFNLPYRSYYFYQGNDAYYAGKSADSCTLQNEHYRQQWLEGYYHGSRDLFS